MGCDWIEWDKNFPDKPEVLALMELSGATLDECTGRLSRFWAWVDDHVGPDAVLPFGSFLGLANKFGGDVKFWESLSCHAVAWIAQKDGAFVIPGWKKRFSEGAKMRANARRRQNRKRKRDKGKRHKNCVTQVSRNGVTETLPTRQDKTRQDKTVQDNKEIPPIVPQGGRARPTLDEVKAYCRERGNSVDPQQWFDHYTANGWKVGKNPMRDWQAAVRTWEKSSHGTNGSAATSRRAQAMDFELDPR